MTRYVKNEFQSKDCADAIRAVTGNRGAESGSADKANWKADKPKCGAAAARMWQQVAEGEFTSDTMEFLQTVATEMVAADSQKKTTRRDAIIQATGLVGASDVDYRLRRISEIGGAFGASPERILQKARRQGIVRGNQVDEKLLPKIRLLMRKSTVLGKVK